MCVGVALRVPGIGLIFPPSSTWFRDLAGFYWRSKQGVGFRRHLEPARRLRCDLWQWCRPVGVDECSAYGGWVVRWGWFLASEILVHNRHSTWTWPIFWAVEWWVGFIRLTREGSGRWRLVGLWGVVLHWYYWDFAFQWLLCTFRG